ncbi:A disintegrin and metalloproteinase with thrombospondin motifs 6-like [Stylophora pistillata]|uniref:A disintegrin and metalloproteinase with thrombospondin motifs 6-like n=1 Tax=Stylophora pistillata TaxID=50429 RepID=UPI000C03E3F3|nr:A disintegrin and metalloproteinase with thrombospondin motifs 6-like [Stylophora pistillata]
METTFTWKLIFCLCLIHEVTSGAISYKESQGRSPGKLHHKMTKREREIFFGTDDLSQVPEYDISEPYEEKTADQRQKRSAKDYDIPDKKYFKIKAFGEVLPLQLKLNQRLMSSDFRVEINRRDGRTEHQPAPKNSFYLGKVVSEPESMVAVSHSEGMHGLIQRSGESLYIQPLPTYLSRHIEHKGISQPHLIVKRSTRENLIFSKRADATLPKRSVRSIGSSNKYLEVALVTDEITAEKYGESKIASILLIIGNIVAGIFQDPSIGKFKITYVIKRVTVLNSAELGLHSLSNNGKIVRLRKWIKEIASSDKVDVTSYMSRSVGSGGLAPFKSMCKNEDGTVNVNNDLGLQSAGIIAHETGHNFGLDHDGSENQCQGSTYLMAAVLPNGVNAMRWSTCSAEEMQAFLRSSGSSCLDDEPT